MLMQRLQRLKLLSREMIIGELDYRAGIAAGRVEAVGVRRTSDD